GNRLHTFDGNSPRVSADIEIEGNVLSVLVFSRSTNSEESSATSECNIFCTRIFRNPFNSVGSGENNLPKQKRRRQVVQNGRFITSSGFWIISQINVQWHWWLLL